MFKRVFEWHVDLSSPSIRHSATEQGYVCVVVRGEKAKEHFVVTAYFTKTIKKGQELWKK